ncbi:MAG: Wzz/FepE/Etk N-terminal domain-containing protein [Pseudomonadota bacterium]|nr:Wzz/FepE/Etk N-terminal domain-containing protein [Pseudomonadota bacterium]MDP1903280.1 Wzz/FepE/Etk N-terminal domain-containing protein [Pseudomonadota bacterium]MDP2353396.1 Wzz/FepE/Etk N-terminal domain-containing protein [Pseudomonadota bacterium]
MNLVLEQILGYARGIWSRRWLVLIIAWLVAVVSWAWIYSLENRYKAQARVYVDTQSLLKPLLGGMTLQPNLGQQVSMMTRTMVSRPNLEKLARMTDLDLRAKTPQQQEALYNGLAAKIALSGGGDNLYSIAYVDSNPDLAKRVVQALLTIFTESSLGGTRQDLSKSQKFIDDQLQGYQEKLLAKEKEMAEFKRRNIDNMQVSTGGFYVQYNQVSSALEEAKRELEEASNRKKQLQQQLEDQEETLVMAAPVTPTTTALDARIAALQMQIDNLRLKYTDLHPEITRTKNLIARLLEQKKQEEVATTKQTQESVKAQNPIYQQLTIAIAEAGANVATLNTRVAQLTKKQNQLYRSVDTVPQLENEYNLMERDHGIYQKSFSTLLDRRETAVMTGEVQTKTDSVEFRVIDPPRVDGKPVWPNRPFLVTVAPFGGIALGAVLAFLLGQLRPTVLSRRQLIELTDLPLLGAVTMIQTDGARSRARKFNYVFFAATGALFVVYLAQIVYYLLLSPAA